MPEYLTYARALVLLREVIAEKGEDYVYPRRDARDVGHGVVVTCFYAEYDQPSCIVGHVLHRAGVPLDQMAVIEGLTPVDDAARPWFAEHADDDARRLLNEVQANQDEQHSWGESLRLALELEVGDRDE